MKTTPPPRIIVKAPGGETIEAANATIAEQLAIVAARIAGHSSILWQDATTNQVTHVQRYDSDAEGAVWTHRYEPRVFGNVRVKVSP